MSNPKVSEAAEAYLYSLRRDLYGEFPGELISMLGEEAAYLFMNAFGGQERVNVPLKVNPSHPWISIIGEGGMKALCDAYGGDRINIPMARRSNKRKYRVAKAILDNTLSRREIARRMGVSERWVRMVAQEMRERGIEMPRPVSLLPGQVYTAGSPDE